VKWEAMMLNAFAHLADWPQTGRLRAEFAPPNIRFWNAGDYLVLYNPSSNPVEIVAILHGAQDLTNLIVSSRLKGDLDAEDDDR
jgi:plasmid stabilization system protein ParE